MKKLLFTALAGLIIAAGCKENKPAEIVDLPRTQGSAELEAVVDSFVVATQTRPVIPDSIAMHSVMILKHGEVVYERWFNGQTAQTPHQMWSVSKTFTATAIGMAIDQGKLALTDKVISFFPDKVPAEPSKNLQAMTVRDLLTMTCGHNAEPKISAFLDPNNQDDASLDWVQAFLAWPVEHTPGEYYMYNSFGTYMLSAIFQTVMGVKVIDYLDEHLFQPLHIARPEWSESPQGINCGGWGLQLKTEDMAKMGQLFLQKGQWNGQQLVSAEWLSEMSSYQVPSAPAGTPYEKLEDFGLNKDNNEWVQGYGYQMWICSQGGFRADGYAGQYIMVFPEKDAVLVLTTSSSLYQPYMDIIYQYLIPAL